MDAISEVQETSSSIGDKSVDVENDDESTGKEQGNELKEVKEEEEEDEEEEDFETYRLRSMNPDDELEENENEENENSLNADDENHNKNENDEDNENHDDGRESTGDREDIDGNEEEEEENEDFTIDIPEETEEEMRIRVREEERIESWRKYVDEQCTTVTFVYGCGKRKEVLIHRLMADYSELQREIARLHPKSKQLFVCQYADGAIVRSADFTPANQFKIRELNITKKVEYDLETRLFHDKLPIKWDFLEYSGSSDVYTEKGKEIRKLEIISDIEASEILDQIFED